MKAKLLLLAALCGLSITAMAQDKPVRPNIDIFVRAETDHYFKLKVERAGKDAPNVVVVLLDDFGFGATGTFGGPIETPASDALAKEGLGYTRRVKTSVALRTEANRSCF